MPFNINQPHGIVSGDGTSAYYLQDGIYYDRNGVAVTTPSLDPLRDPALAAHAEEHRRMANVVEFTKGLTGGSVFSAGIVDLSDALGLHGVKMLGKAALSSGIPVDFSSGTLVQSGAGGLGVVDATQNIYGSKTIRLTMGGMDAAYCRFRKVLSPTQPSMDIDGGPFVVVAEIVRGFSEGDTINLTLSSDAFASKNMSASFNIAKSTRAHGNLYIFAIPTSAFSINNGEVWANAMNYMHVQVNCATAQANVVTIDIPSSTLAGDLANDSGVRLTTTGALPTGLAVATTYYVVNATGTTYQLSATKAGAAISLSGTQSGVQNILTSGGEILIHGVYQYSKGRAKCVIDFDDNFISQYTQAFPVMAKWGMVGSVAVIAARVGTAGYCTEAQLTEMYNAGWDMVVHGDTPHSSFGTDALLTADIIANRDYISERWPRGAKDYVYPAGIIGTNSKAILASLGFRSARTTRYTLQATQPFGADDPFCLYGLSLSQSSTNAAILAGIEAAKAAGATLRLYGHRVLQTVVDATSEITITDFATIVDALGADVAAHKIDVPTAVSWADAVIGV